MVLDNHLAHQIEEMIRPIPMDDAHLQADLIENVGVGGEFLTKRETLNYTREEYIPVWPPYGEELSKIIRSEAEEIYHNHKSPPLPDGASSKIEDILKEADKALQIKE
jgi:trimethylamine:corrinoid methyltransferase-like protein